MNRQKPSAEGLPAFDAYTAGEGVKSGMDATIRTIIDPAGLGTILASDTARNFFAGMTGGQRVGTEAPTPEATPELFSREGAREVPVANLAEMRAQEAQRRQEQQQLAMAASLGQMPRDQAFEYLGQLSRFTPAAPNTEETARRLALESLAPYEGRIAELRKAGDVESADALSEEYFARLGQIYGSGSLLSKLLGMNPGR